VQNGEKLSAWTHQWADRYTEIMKPVKIVVGLVLIAVAGSVVFWLASGPHGRPEVTTSETSIPTGPQAPATQSAAGSYVDYAPTTIANTSGTKILFFHASWCPQCRQLEADIKQRGVPAGVTIIKVDYDRHQELRQQYGVTLQATLVRVDDDGQLVKKFVAYDDPSLAAVKQMLL
jgi:thiol-disulfide isomerase/thioredoxin